MVVLHLNGVGQLYFLKLIRYLNNAYHHFVWVTVFIQQAEFNRRIIAVELRFHIYNLIILQMLLNFFLKNEQCVGKINFNGAGVVGRCFHRGMAQQIR